MRGFYTVFDSDNGLIGITPHSNTMKKPLQYALRQPTHYLNDGERALYKELEIGGTILVLIIILYIVCIFEGPKLCAWLRKVFSKKSKKRMEESNVDGDAAMLMSYLNEKLELEVGQTQKTENDQKVNLVILN